VVLRNGFDYGTVAWLLHREGASYWISGVLCAAALAVVASFDDALIAGIVASGLWAADASLATHAKRIY
jgi:hypothetical protein